MHTQTGGLDVPTGTNTKTISPVAASAHTERTKTQLDVPGATKSTSIPPAPSPHTENTRTRLDQPTTTADGTIGMPGTGVGEVTPSAHTELPGGPSLVGPTQGPTIAPSAVTAITQVSLQGPGSATALPQNNGGDGAFQGPADIGGIIASILGSHGQGSNGGSGVANAGPEAVQGAGSPAQGSAFPAQTYYASSLSIVAGSSPVVVAGTTYSLAPSGTTFFVNGQQNEVPEGVRPTSSGIGATETYYILNTPVVAGSSGVAIAGTTYSLAPSGAAFFINGQQTAVPEGVRPTPGGIGAAETYYISNTPIAAGSSGVAIGGTTYSLAPSGTAFFVNGQQTNVPTMATSSSGASGQVAVETESASAPDLGTVAGTSATSSSSIGGASSIGSQSAAPAQQTDSGASELLMPALGLGAVGMLACLL